MSKYEYLKIADMLVEWSDKCERLIQSLTDHDKPLLVQTLNERDNAELLQWVDVFYKMPLSIDDAMSNGSNWGLALWHLWESKIFVRCYFYTYNKGSANGFGVLHAIGTNEKGVFYQNEFSANGALVYPERKNPLPMIEFHSKHLQSHIFHINTKLPLCWDLLPQQIHRINNQIAAILSN